MSDIKFPHGNVGNNFWCWIVNYRLKEKKKILKKDLDYWLKLGWVTGGPATKFSIGKRLPEGYKR